MQHDPVELGHAGLVGLVQNDEADAAEGEHEGGGQTLHDVLAVDAVLHEGHGAGVPLLVRRRTHGRGLHYHVVDDAAWNVANFQVAKN